MVEPVSIACQMFIVPASVLFIALAVASTEALKALISLMALGISVLWIVRVWTWKQISTGDLYTALALALIFFVAALLTFFAHGNAWWRARNALPTGSRISGLRRSAGRGRARCFAAYAPLLRKRKAPRPAGQVPSLQTWGFIHAHLA